MTCAGTPKTRRTKTPVPGFLLGETKPVPLIQTFRPGMLCQSLNAELAPQGIHVCHANIDGTVDAPESIGKIVPEFYAEMKARLEILW